MVVEKVNQSSFHGPVKVSIYHISQTNSGVYIKRFLIDNTYLFTPWNRVLLEKLTGLQLVKKFPAFYGTRMFITALTSARHLSLC